MMDIREKMMCDRCGEPLTTRITNLEGTEVICWHCHAKERTAKAGVSAGEHFPKEERDRKVTA